MKYKLIAVDIDGTLLNSHSEITPATSRAIQRVYEAGVKIVISTGRRFYSAKPIAEQLKAHLFISCHNGVLLKRLNGEVLYYRPLACETAKRAIKYVKETGEFPIVYHGQQDAANIFVESLHANVSERIAQYIQENQQFVTTYENLESQLEHDILEIVSIISRDQIDEVYEYLKEKLSSAEIIRWMPSDGSVSFLEIAHKNTSKAEPLKYLAYQFGIKREEIIAIGDNFNDIAMLQYAGLPVVMENAPEELKKFGFHVTSSNDEDGIAEVIENFIII